MIAPKAGEWDVVVYAFFSCPRCGAQPKQFCRRWPYWDNMFLQYLGDRYHEERIVKAMLVCDGDRSAPYRRRKRIKTDVR